MTTYTIYLNRIEVSFDNIQCSATLDYKLRSLADHLFDASLRVGLGKGSTYRRISCLIDNLLDVIDSRQDVNEESVAYVLRCALSFLRRLKFRYFQIIILNHV